MNRLYKRPMFRRGGSAEGGITSGLGRPGYAKDGAVKELTTRDRMLQAVGATPRGQNFNDFLINFGLDLGSRSPQGNILQTAAASAKDPYSKFAKANQAEQNLLRQVGLEAEGIDIKNEQDIAAAEALEGGATKRLQMTIKSDAETYDKQLLIQEALDKKKWVATYVDANKTNSQEGENMYEWMFETFNKPENVGKNNGGTVSQDILLDARKRSNDAKSKLRKNKAKAERSLYYDKVQGTVLKIGTNANGDITYIPVESFTETTSLKSPETIIEENKKKEAEINERFRFFDKETGKKIDKFVEPNEGEGDFGSGA